jgi:Shikimate kinase
MIAALTGFMASGKTTFGGYAAALLNWRFIDLDKEIAARQGVEKVADIFTEKGEEYFRRCESETLETILAAEDNIVLALGGGTILQEHNRELLRSHACVIWLKTSMDIVWSKLHNSDRPLAKGRSREDIEALYESRKPLYEAVADVVFEVNTRDFKTVVRTLAEKIYEESTISE